MGRIANAIDHLHMMDMESRQRGRLQSLHPLGKLLVTIVYIAFVVSFNKYDISGLIMMGIYPIIMFSLGDISAKHLFHRMKVLMLFVCFIGLLNPFFDRDTVMTIGSLKISGGVISMFSLILKGLYAITAAYILMVTTTMEDICRALRKIHLPEVLVTVIMMIYRYIIVFLKEVERISEAYSLRAPSQRGINIKAWGSLVGQTLLRSIDRAEIVYDSMQVRGYRGDYFLKCKNKATATDYIFCLIWVAAFIILRLI